MAGGPSHLDAKQYRYILTSEKYNQENKELLVQLTTLARAMATNVLHLKMLEALVAYRDLPFL